MLARHRKCATFTTLLRVPPIICITSPPCFVFHCVRGPISTTASREAGGERPESSERGLVRRAFLESTRRGPGHHFSSEISAWCPFRNSQPGARGETWGHRHTRYSSERVGSDVGHARTHPQQQAHSTHAAWPERLAVGHVDRAWTCSTRQGQRTPAHVQRVGAGLRLASAGAVLTPACSAAAP